MVICACNPSTGGQTQADPVSLLSSQPSQMASLWLCERPCLRAIKQKPIEEDTQLLVLVIVCTHEGTHTCTYTVPYTHTTQHTRHTIGAQHAAHTITLALRRQEQKEHGFGASLSYKMRPCFRNQKVRLERWLGA